MALEAMAAPMEATVAMVEGMEATGVMEWEWEWGGCMGWADMDLWGDRTRKVFSSTQ